MLAIVFWVSAGLLIYTQAGYGALLAVLARLRRPRGAGSGAAPELPSGARAGAAAELPRGAGADAAPELPSVSVIVAAYAEQDVIADRVANLRALEYPADRLEVIVSCDGSPDATAPRARGAGADLVLELPRGGKIRAQDAGVERARGECWRSPTRT